MPIRRAWWALPAAIRVDVDLVVATFLQGACGWRGIRLVTDALIETL